LNVDVYVGFVINSNLIMLIIIGILVLVSSST